MLKGVAEQDAEGCLLQDMCVELELDTGNLHGEVLCTAVTADMMPIADVCKNDTTEGPLAYLDAYDSSYKEESAEYSQYTQDEEELSDDPWDAS